MEENTGREGRRVENRGCKWERRVGGKEIVSERRRKNKGGDGRGRQGGKGVNE